MEYLRRRMHINDQLTRCLLSEFISTAMLVHGGTAVNAHCVLEKAEYGKVVAALGWGVAVCFAAFTGLQVSGSLMNPAITFSQFICGQLSFTRLVLYALVQTLGAFVGSLLTYILFLDSISKFDGGTRQVLGPNATFSIFAPFPQEHLSIFGCIIDQTMASAYLCVCLSAICDKHSKVPLNAQPLICIGLVVAIIFFYGLNAGAEINPARDLGPKLMAICVGYDGWELISYRNYSWFLVPIICPFLGAAIGTILYHIFVGFHMPMDGEYETLKSTPTATTITTSTIPSTKTPAFRIWWSSNDPHSNDGATKSMAKLDEQYLAAICAAC